MLIKLINPNRTATITKLMGGTARTVSAVVSEIVPAASRSGAAYAGKLADDAPASLQLRHNNSLSALAATVRS